MLPGVHVPNNLDADSNGIVVQATRQRGLNVLSSKFHGGLTRLRIAAKLLQLIADLGSHGRIELLVP